MEQNYILSIENCIEACPETKMEILWQKTQEGARINRVFSQDMFLEVPAYIEGNLVTEIGPYCFSSSERFSLEEDLLTLVELGQNGARESRIAEPSMPQAAGKYLEGLILPDSVIRLHSGAFYNCRNLKVLSIGSQLNNLGGDVFTNCLRLTHLTVRGSVEEKSGLPLILETMKTEVEVTFQPKGYEKGQAEECRLFFPECYEEYDEMITAHVFNRVIIGEGFRMRQCFQEHRMQFAKYDQCAANSVKLEGEREICQIAMNRLRWPVHLKEEYKIIYEKTIKERYDQMIKMIISQKNLEELKFLCQHFKPEREHLSRWMEACIRADWIEGNVIIMEEKNKGSTFAEKSFDFEDWDML